MKEQQKEEAVNFQPDQPSFKGSESPAQICNTLRVRILCLILDIEELLYRRELIHNHSFLAKIASDIVSLNSLSDCSGICSQNIVEAGNIIRCILTCPVKLKNSNKEISTLEAALRYRKDTKYIEVFSKILEAFQEEADETQTLLNELKLLAFDLTS